MDDRELEARLLLIDAAGGRPQPLRSLLHELGSARAVLEAGPRRWREVGLGQRGCERLQAPDRQRLAAGREWLTREGHHLLHCDEPDYPPLLAELPSAPLGLFVRGSPETLWRPQVAIVGSRNASAGGCRNAGDFAGTLARAGLCVTSGLAAGVDACAHAAAVDTAAGSIAVVGTGPDRVYPARHGKLAERVAQSGALVSELMPGTPPLPEHFPRRNRLIAGLALGVLVVEAGLRSGSLITARLATEAGREVMAIPGSIHNPLARGCHRLIREGALLVETAQDVLDALAPLAAALGERLRGRLASLPQTPTPDREAVGDPTARKVLDCIGSDAVDIDTLVQRSGLTVANLSSILLELELEGRVALDTGGLWVRLRPAD